MRRILNPKYLAVLLACVVCLSTGSALAAYEWLHAVDGMDGGPGLSVLLHVEPGVEITVGEEMTFHYTLENVSGGDLYDLTFYDGIMMEKPVDIAWLGQGKKAEISCAFRPEELQFQTEAMVSFRTEARGEAVTRKLDSTYVNATVPSVSVNVYFSGYTGDGKALIEGTIENFSSAPLVNARLTDNTLGDLMSGLTIGPSDRITFARAVSVPKEITLQFFVAGDDVTGTRFVFGSGEFTVSPQEAQDAQEIAAEGVNGSRQWRDNRKELAVLMSGLSLGAAIPAVLEAIAGE